MEATPQPSDADNAAMDEAIHRFEVALEAMRFARDCGLDFTKSLDSEPSPAKETIN
jgi:hypothetical protein